MAAEQGAGKLGCTWRLASEQGTGTLNAGCVPDGCTWRLSSADLGQPREIPFIAAQIWCLVQRERPNFKLLPHGQNLVHCENRQLLLRSLRFLRVHRPARF